MFKKNEYDVIVVGAGPGGATVATLIAKRNHSVLLIDKQEFPRHMVGESLLPSTVQGVCNILGVKEKIDNAGFMPKRGGTFIWGKSKEPWTFFFEKAPKGKVPRPSAYQVERSKFDKILLDNAISHGVEVVHGAVAKDIIQNSQRVTGVTGISLKNNEAFKLSTKYLVDASGHGSKLIKHVGERMYSKFFQNFAIYGYFKNAKRLPYPREGNILCEAVKGGWLWYIPLTDKLTSVGTVIDKSLIDIKSNSLEEIFYNFINKSTRIKEYLNNSTREESELYSPIRIRKDYSYIANRLWIPGMAIIGDAAGFIDPVFSSGVHLSTFAALMLGRAINTIFDNNESRETQCFNEFQNRYYKEYSNFYNYLIGFYDMHKSKDDYFWEARKILNTEEKENDAFIRLISGYSVDGICSNSNPHDFFNNRNELGNEIGSFFDDSSFITNKDKNKIDIKSFMTDLNRVNVDLQAQGMGVKLLAQNKFGFKISDDLLSWKL